MSFSPHRLTSAVRSSHGVLCSFISTVGSILVTAEYFDTYIKALSILSLHSFVFGSVLSTKLFKFFDFWSFFQSFVLIRSRSLHVDQQFKNLTRLSLLYTSSVKDGPYKIISDHSTLCRISDRSSRLLVLLGLPAGSTVALTTTQDNYRV